MRINIKVKTRAKNPKIEKIGNNSYKISVKEAPEKGKANEAVLKTLAKYLNLGVSSFKIIKGQTTTNKIIEVKTGSK